jgi:tol-pal system protein YbgF
MPRLPTSRALQLAFVGGIALLTLAGCADRGALLQREITELRRKLEATRHERDEAKAKAEELQNQVIILEDRLAATNGAKDEPRRPQVITVRPAPVPEPAKREAVADPDDPDIEYDGAARDTRSPRPVLRIDGPYARRGVAADTEAEAKEPRPARQGRRPVAQRRTPPAAADGDRLPVVPLPDAGVPARPAQPGTAKAPPPGAAKPAQPGTAKAPPPPAVTKASPLALYQRSLDALRRKDHSEAIAGFQDLTRAYPKHALAENAQYWTGEAYYDQRNYTAALAEFRKLVREHAGGHKASDALLKAGYCHQKLGDQKSARNLLGQVVELYPKSAAAKLAAERLRDLR